MSQEIDKYFKIEARELLDSIGKDLLELEKECTPAIVGRLFRYAHTLKGAARVVKQFGIADGAHQLEELLTPYREGEAVERGGVDRMLGVLEGMEKKLGVMEGRGGESATATATAMVTAAGVVEKETGSGTSQQGMAAVGAVSFGGHNEGSRSVRAEVGEIDVVVDAVSAALAELNALRMQLSKLDELRQIAELCNRQLTAPRRSTVRAAVIDKARALAEELSVSTRTLDANMTATVEKARRELERARAQADQLRLSPASLMFSSLERAVRDAAHDLKKDVRVVTRGGETRLDGGVLEIVQAALFHVVRNAVAHGIESSSQRQARGKPAHGTVRIEVGREGSRVAFRCADDGRGLDVAAIRKALQNAGKNVAPIPEMRSEQLLELLLRSGVSTSSHVDSISGRGVGLDVLREAAERLNGTVRFDSQPGRGFLVELVVPLSVAALDTLAVECDGRPASLPLDSVRRSVRLPSQEIANSANGQSLVHDGVALPFLPLAAALRSQQRRASSATTTAVIVDSAAGALALGVDRIVGTKTVVLRKLPALLPPHPLIAGAALDALGNPELVLDPEGLYAEAQRPAGSAARTLPARLPILIIDDSLTTRMLEQSILESAGYKVALACSAEEGLEKAREGRYGMFLVDVEMPGMDGFSFVETTQRDPVLQQIPAILVSSRDAPEDLARGKAAGARGYIVKGRFDQRELLGLIGKLLVGR